MTVASSIQQFILTEIGADASRQSLDPNADLIEQRIIDSLAILKLVAFLESSFGIKVEDEDIVPENFQTLNSLAAFVERKTAASPRTE